MSESNYWLEVIKAILDSKKTEKELDWLINESEELDNILGSIVMKTGKKTECMNKKFEYF